MKSLSNEEKRAQCTRELRATLLLTAICACWHIVWAFVLSGSGTFLLGMPAWFTVSVFGTIVIAIVGVIFLTRRVFVDFSYDEEEEADK